MTPESQAEREEIDERRILEALRQSGDKSIWNFVDEWKRQHENLVEVRRQDLANMMKAKWDADRAALTAHPASAPEGWKLVPMEPTKDMLWAAGSVKVGYDNENYYAADCSEYEARSIYEQMLAAAPVPGAKEGT